MLTATIQSKVDQLWDRFWSGGIANPLTAIEQISYLLFMRRLDAVDQKRKEDAEWLKRDYASLYAGEYRRVDQTNAPKEELRWASFLLGLNGRRADAAKIIKMLRLERHFENAKRVVEIEVLPQERLR